MVMIVPQSLEVFVSDGVLWTWKLKFGQFAKNWRICDVPFNRVLLSPMLHIDPKSKKYICRNNKLDFRDIARTEFSYVLDL